MDGGISNNDDLGLMREVVFENLRMPLLPVITKVAFLVLGDWSRCGDSRQHCESWHCVCWKFWLWLIQHCRYHRIRKALFPQINDLRGIQAIAVLRFFYVGNNRFIANLRLLKLQDLRYLIRQHCRLVRGDDSSPALNREFPPVAAVV